ncbi:hypothetical protein BRARA_I04843 [Brassica rapa]|uniref:Carbohydrate kinase PfkB domain-containing protein n=3 Tax=Brassica TaxID=3705 RepID=A0A397Y438_BRACM|nr:hypothetical protein BRARA_I04843 [Brassica rapa]
MFRLQISVKHLAKEGETISAKTGQTLAGGKGANQAACGAKLLYPTYFVGPALGDECGVHLDYVRSVTDEQTGHAVVMLRGWPEKISDDELEVVRNAGVVLLQRDLPDSFNIQVAKDVKKVGVPVILDVGGMDTPIPNELLDSIDILSPNETELSRLTGMPTETFEQISQAVAKCHNLGVKQVIQSVIPASQVLDTTGAGDTFTAAFAVAMVEGKSHEECLRFATAAASLCVQVKGAIPSMPDQTSVMKLLESSI